MLFVGFTSNPVCGTKYSGPADRSTDLILTFSCQSLLGRFVSVQRSGLNVSLAIGHLKIDTVPSEGKKKFNFFLNLIMLPSFGMDPKYICFISRISSRHYNKQSCQQL